MTRVWDWPIRLFHWLLVLAIIGLFVTGKLGGNWMEWHQPLGAFVLGLIVFRIIWGFVGSYHARFANFVRGPGGVIGYLKTIIGKSDGPAATHLGHNPLGALSVLAMLLVIGFQAVSGLFADDDILASGPYAAAVSKAVSDWLTKMHKLNSDLILILIGLHIAAIAFYFFVKKDNLVKPMLTGDKEVVVDGVVEPMVESANLWWRFGVIALLVAGGVYAVYTKALWK